MVFASCSSFPLGKNPLTTAKPQPTTNSKPNGKANSKQSKIFPYSAPVALSLLQKKHTPTAVTHSFASQANVSTKSHAKLGKAYQIKGRWYYPKKDVYYSKVGVASWYGSQFHGNLTANGEIFNMNALTAAHPTMPLPSYARVTNLQNGASLIVRVNDRGPFINGRIIDLSKKAAKLLSYHHEGVTNVKVEYVGPALIHGGDHDYLESSFRPGLYQNSIEISPAMDDKAHFLSQNIYKFYQVSL